MEVKTDGQRVSSTISNSRYRALEEELHHNGRIALINRQSRAESGDKTAQIELAVMQEMIEEGVVIL